MPSLIPFPIRVKRSLLKAIGEIFMIIIGILIAFQVQKWGETKSRRELEIQTLIEIKKGFEKDIRDIQFNIMLHKSSTYSGKAIIDHFQQDLPYNDSLETHFSTVLWYSRLVINRSPFETLKSRGLDLISNNKLREKVIEIYEYQYPGIQAFEKSLFIDREYVSQIIATRFDKTELWIPLSQDSVVAGHMRPNDFESLRCDKVYLHVIRTLISSNDLLVEFFIEKSLSSLEQTVRELDAEILRLTR